MPNLSSAHPGTKRGRSPTGGIRHVVEVLNIAHGLHAAAMPAQRQAQAPTAQVFNATT